MGLIKCKDTRCKTWPFADLSSNSIQNVANLNYDFCKITHAIYKLTCTVCGQAYIGQASTELHLRMNNHRNKSYKVNEKSTFELKHFNIHEFHNVKIQIIEQIVDEDLRLKSENFYILRFKTLYPYGLNTKLNHHPVNVDCIYSLFSSVYIPSFHYNRGKRGNHTNKTLQNKYHNVIPAIILHDLYNLFNANYCATYIKNVLFGLKFKLAIQKFNCDNKQFIDLINDVLLYKIGWNKTDTYR